MKRSLQFQFEFPATVAEPLPPAARWRSGSSQFDRQMATPGRRFKHSYLDVKNLIGMPI